MQAQRLEIGPPFPPHTASCRAKHSLALAPTAIKRDRASLAASPQVAGRTQLSCGASHILTLAPMSWSRGELSLHLHKLWNCTAIIPRPYMCGGSDTVGGIEPSFQRKRTTACSSLFDACSPGQSHKSRIKYALLLFSGWKLRSALCSL